MCRLLFVKSEHEFEIGSHLARFAEISRNSQEYQGHGWGCGYVKNNRWHIHKSINAIWEDDFEHLGRTTRLVAHARSAFKNQDICIENNMPFHDSGKVFIFNGELHGVTLKESGQTGAHKIFNFIKRFDTGDSLADLKKTVGIINRRTRYIRAMNIILSDSERAYVVSMFNEKPEYFTMYQRQTNGELVICSGKYAGEESWRAIGNHSIEVFEL